MGRPPAPELPVQDARDREQFTHDAVVAPVQIDGSRVARFGRPGGSKDTRGSAFDLSIGG